MRSVHRVTVIVGTRPESIKLIPVVHALTRIGLSVRVLFTGQHPLRPGDHDWGLADMLAVNCPGGGDPYAHSQNVAQLLSPLVRASGMLVVQGDTSSALGGAIAARQLGVAIAHVEAGLRTHDPEAPWPEEEFRLQIDRMADLLFAPTRLSAANLRRERVRGEVHVTGNTAIDALLPEVAEPCPTGPADSAKRPRILVTCHRRENWGGGLADIASALRRIAERGIAEIDLVLHPNPAVATAMREWLSGYPRISLLAPVAHSEMLRRMGEATLILSDSGGLQEEAPVLGIPLLILRDTSERPEALVSGRTEIVGTDPARILAAVERRLTRPGRLAPAFPHGDGQAGRRIASAIAEWLAIRGELDPAGDLMSPASPALRRAG